MWWVPSRAEPHTSTAFRVVTMPIMHTETPAMEDMYIYIYMNVIVVINKGYLG